VPFGILNLPQDKNVTASIFQMLPPNVLIDTDELYLGGKAKKMNRDTAVNEND
jgi:hypothetical protein